MSNLVDFPTVHQTRDFSMLNPEKGHGMDHIVITGLKGKGLFGKVKAMGSKNASLPQMVASILTADRVTLTNLPALADLETMAYILSAMGIDIDSHDFAEHRRLTFTAEQITNPFASYDMVRKMRASVFVLGPLLARAGRAMVSLPGGCAIGARPVDLHTSALVKMGADINIVDGYISAEAHHGLTGAEIVFPVVSVGATENTMMAATLAKGRTVIKNAACEPEVVDLGKLLISMGAKIAGLGTDEIVIDGVAKLYGTSHEVIPDRIEVGSLLLTVVGTGGAVTINHANPQHLTAVIELVQQMGADIIIKGNDIIVTMERRPKAVKGVVTNPYPDFPTDLQAQLMAVLAVADGESDISETIFENRYMHVPELNRLGADITINHHIAKIRGVKQLQGAPVMATDLRASMSLVMAGLMAEGQTSIGRPYHLDRGYDGLEEKLHGLGATIARKP